MKEELAYHMFNMEELPMVEQDLKEAVEKKCQGDQPFAVHVKEVRPGLTLIFRVDPATWVNSGSFSPPGLAGSTLDLVRRMG
jgi:hypothetical protein